MILLFPLLDLTHLSSSPFFNLTAISPDLLTFANSSISVFFIIPFFVAITRNFVSSFLSIEITAVTISSVDNWRKLTIA